MRIHRQNRSLDSDDAENDEESIALNLMTEKLCDISAVAEVDDEPQREQPVSFLSDDPRDRLRELHEGELHLRQNALELRELNQIRQEMIRRDVIGRWATRASRSLDDSMGSSSTHSRHPHTPRSEKENNFHQSRLLQDEPQIVQKKASDLLNELGRSILSDVTNTTGEVNKAAYATKAEVARLMQRLDDLDQKIEKIQIIPEDISTQFQLMSKVNEYEVCILCEQLLIICPIANLGRFGP